MEHFASFPFLNDPTLSQSHTTQMKYWFPQKEKKEQNRLPPADTLQHSYYCRAWEQSRSVVVQ